MVPPSRPPAGTPFHPIVSPAKKDDRERLAAALRQNLKRRKQPAGAPKKDG